MRFIQPEPKQAAREIASEAYSIYITVNDVATVLKDRLSSRIKRYFRGAAQHLIIAISLTEATKIDLVCAIRYPRALDTAGAAMMFWPAILNACDLQAVKSRRGPTIKTAKTDKKTFDYSHNIFLYKNVNSCISTFQFENHFNECIDIAFVI